MKERTYAPELTGSRFFLQSDEHADRFVFPLPSTWWSRRYEYVWCSSFARPGDVVLDAACGISHPFKLYLGSVSREVHACDQDPRIESAAAIAANILLDFGPSAGGVAELESLVRPLHRLQADITKLPYGDGQFDTVFCISVLEHMSAEDMGTALAEFARTLKPGGYLSLTFDYPTVDLGTFRSAAGAAGLQFAGDVDESLPPDALFSDLWGRLYCYRALLYK